MRASTRPFFTLSPALTLSFCTVPAAPNARSLTPSLTVLPAAETYADTLPRLAAASEICPAAEDSPLFT
jgi:hypothetical protein